MGGEVVVVGDDHAAFAGGDLLVGIEGEDAGPAERADGARSRMLEPTCPPKPSQAVFDEDQFVLLGELFQFDHAARVAEGFDGDDGLGLGCDGGGGLGDVQIEGLGMMSAKTGLAPT